MIRGVVQAGLAAFVLPALAQQTSDTLFVGHRYTGSEVVFFTTSSYSGPEPRGRKLRQPFAEYARGLNLHETDERELRRWKFEKDIRPRAGERISVDLGGGRIVDATVRSLVLLVTCSDTQLGALAEVDSAGLPTYTKARAVHYLVSRVQTRAPKSGDEVLNTVTLTPEVHDKLSRALHAEFRKQHATMIRKSDIYEGLNARERERWTAIDRRLTGEGRLVLRVRSVLLAGGREIWLARARWSVGTETGFLMSAWIDPRTLELESVDTSYSQAMRMPEYQGSNLSLQFVSDVVNVFHHSGGAFVLMRSHGYESIRLSVLKRVAGKWVEAGVEFAQGC